MQQHRKMQTNGFAFFYAVTLKIFANNFQQQRVFTTYSENSYIKCFFCFFSIASIFHGENFQRNQNEDREDG